MKNLSRKCPMNWFIFYKGFMYGHNQLPINDRISNKAIINQMIANPAIFGRLYNSIYIPV